MLTSYANLEQPSSAQKSFTLYIRKPTTDLLTWDRTQAALDTSPPGTDSQVRQDRIAYWERFHRLARQQKTTNDLAIDDPAVDSLTITVTLNGDNNPLPCKGSSTLPWATIPASTQPGPNALQATPPPITIAIIASPSGDPTLTRTPSSTGSPRGHLASRRASSPKSP